MAVPQGPVSAQQLRLTIAFAALRHKPPGQSFEAYVLDLQEKFLASAEAQREPPWRERALDLEKQLAGLKRKYEEEHIELISLRETQTGTQVSEPASSAPSSTDKKKKKKKNTQQVQSEPPAAPVESVPIKLTLRNVLLDSKTRSALPAVCSGDNVLSSLESLDTLLAVHTTNKSAVAPRALVLCL
ncbi:hypothetical protein CERSUDRAFT_89974 [Gelatoporia subvermispora B]|uniref:Uncharacterized protein n=1 Tax=Ceriporiopsis subvermispora (strain B) TaxID=914234 RepID=M2PX57_CERS8|nr:hypothetical protein CERSUDRAFT_89974 [Gelatoporia subvermispora B]